MLYSIGGFDFATRRRRKRMKRYLMKCKVSALSFGIAEVVTAIENVLLAYVFQFIVAIAAGETNRGAVALRN